MKNEVNVESGQCFFIDCCSITRLSFWCTVHSTCSARTLTAITRLIMPRNLTDSAFIVWFSPVAPLPRQSKTNQTRSYEKKSIGTRRARKSRPCRQLTWNLTELMSRNDELVLVQVNRNRDRIWNPIVSTPTISVCRECPPTSTREPARKRRRDDVELDDGWLSGWSDVYGGRSCPTKKDLLGNKTTADRFKPIQTRVDRVANKRMSVGIANPLDQPTRTRRIKKACLWPRRSCLSTIAVPFTLHAASRKTWQTASPTFLRRVDRVSACRPQTVISKRAAQREVSVGRVKTIF